MRYIFFSLLLTINSSIKSMEPAQPDRQKLLRKQKEKLQEKINQELRLSEMEQRIQNLEREDQKKEILILKLQISQEEKRKRKERFQAIFGEKSEDKDAKSSLLQETEHFLQNEMLAFVASESSLYLVNKFVGEPKEPTIKRRFMNFLAVRVALEVAKRVGPRNLCMLAGGVLLGTYLCSDVELQGYVPPMEYFDTQDLIPGCAVCNGCWPT